jgi:hypothetical protein
MPCLRCLCVQCRDSMNLVDTHNGISDYPETSPSTSLKTSTAR